jgi:uncharacterized protein YidB (DUF937 family)
MGLLDEVIGAIEGKTDQHASVAASVLEMIQGASGGAGGAGGLAGAAGALLGGGGGGNLASMVEKMAAGGLGNVVQSWIGTGANLPVNAAQLEAALGTQVIQAIAAKAGLDASAVTPILAQVLPGIIDKLTPGGHLPGAAPAPSA